MSHDEWCAICSTPGHDCLPKISLRDLFAAAALAGLLAPNNSNAQNTGVAAAAYRWADAMLAQRERKA